MTIPNVKAMVVKAITVGLVAGALAMVAPAKAEAQHFTFGVQVGGPVYGYQGGYDRERYEAYCRQQEYVRQQANLRQQAFLQHDAWERHEHEAWEHGGDRRDFRHNDDGFRHDGNGFRGNDARYENGRQWDGR